jgi:DNA helicase-2/ATP-dependent DNA helicase PcrA
MIDFEQALNTEQLRAVQAGDGPVLVIAAAGTGKTRTLTYRVAYLAEQEVDADRILLLTFTNKAAREMLDRARDLVGERVSGLWGGTFHHMANRMLRRHAAALGYGTDYTILDQDDARGVVRTCVEELGLKSKEFPKPDVLLGIYGLASGKQVPVQDVAANRFGDIPGKLEDIERVHRRYQEKKRGLNAMDFDDLLANGLKLFDEHPSILERYQTRFKYVMVDEYQDTNVIQAQWVDHLAAANRNLLVVGDDFQSIYSWRGADFRNILTFPERYPDAKTFKLETNYRSVPEILEVANASIAGNPEQFQKTLKAVREDYKRPHYVELRSGDEQAHFIINKLAELRREGYRMKDVAILYRAHYQAMELQLELARADLSYQITSGVRFFEQAHIKDVCSLLRILCSPGDQIGFLRLMELLPRVGQKTALKVWDKMRGRFDARDPHQRLAIQEALPAATRDTWSRLAPLVEAYVDEELHRQPGEIIYRFAEAFYESYAKDTFENYAQRLEDVGELVVFAGRYTSTESFLNEVALLTNVDTEAADRAHHADDAIRLSTIHQAKGLEWQVVFVLWMAEGMFPSSRSMQEAGGEEEERRLFYVATTRAKDELYLCYPATRRARDGSVAFFPPSRFIREIPDALLESVSR